MKKIEYMGASPRPAFRDYPRQVWDTFVGARRPTRTSSEHLAATMRWLCAAQDVGDDDGVSRMYHVRNGWGASYPETTGYIIPSMLNYSKLSGDTGFSDRAIRMATWESDIQLTSGAVQGGVIGDDPSPAIFNTGQVLFGWCAAWAHVRDQAFRSSAETACRYLIEQLDDDGAWRRNLSDYCDSPDDTYAFNVRSAWAMLCAARVFNIEACHSAATANVDFVVGLANDNGWIRKNCLNRPKQPLLHTIAYAYQGLLECAEIANHDAAMALVLAGNEELRKNFDYFGHLHGRYADNWNPTVRWRCLTGEAQTAIVWYRLATVTGDDGWRTAADALLHQVKMTQQLSGGPGIAGGIKGSQPISAPYGRMTYLNWAAKFYADAIMLELGVEGSSQDG